MGGERSSSGGENASFADLRTDVDLDAGILSKLGDRQAAGDAAAFGKPDIKIVAGSSSMSLRACSRVTRDSSAITGCRCDCALVSCRRVRRPRRAARSLAN